MYIGINKNAEHHMTSFIVAAAAAMIFFAVQCSSMLNLILKSIDQNLLNWNINDGTFGVHKFVQNQRAREIEWEKETNQKKEQWDRNDQWKKNWKKN